MSVRQGNKIIAGSLSSLPHNIGEIFPAPYASYTPEGAVLADGAEFDSTQFPDLFNDWLQGGRLQTITYSEFQTEIDTKGYCYKFAVNGNKFKVPYVVDEVVGGTVGVKGNGITLGLTDGKINCGIGNGSDTTYTSLTKPVLYGVPVGTKISQGGDAMKLASFGVTTDSSKSGMIVELPKEPVKHYVQVASGSVNQSMMDWSRYMQGLEGKANTDLSNVVWNDAFNTDSGYLYLPNGLLIQWGTIEKGTGTISIPLKKPYADKNYFISRTIQTSYTQSYGQIAAGATVNSIDTTNFTITRDASDSGNSRWFTIGQGA